MEQLQRMRELLACIELNAGLTFRQLIGESVARLPRDATVLAVLAEVTVETALTLGTLRRRGFAVTAVLVLFEEDALERAHRAEELTRIEHRAYVSMILGDGYQTLWSAHQ